MIDLGTYVYGDTEDTTLHIVDEDGDPLTLLDTTNVKLECRTVHGETLEIACSILDEDNGIVLVPSIGTAFVPTSERPVAKFEARVKRTQSGTERWTRDAVRFTIELFP